MNEKEVEKIIKLLFPKREYCISFDSSLIGNMQYGIDVYPDKKSHALLRGVGSTWEEALSCLGLKKCQKFILVKEKVCSYCGRKTSIHPKVVNMECWLAYPESRFRKKKCPICKGSGYKIAVKRNEL
jgi:hypothetical protein